MKLVPLVFVLLLLRCAAPSDQTPSLPVPGAQPDWPVADDGALLAFPGAQGFGAKTSGGRGGRVLHVTSLGTDPDSEGTLAWALAQPGKRYVVFDVSGRIPGQLNVRHGEVTIAGQTSPGGIIVDSILCDAIYERDADCDQVIMRHLRLRPAGEADDALRLGGASNVIIDHVSAETATDEQMEITRSHAITVQRSLLGDPVGEHFDYSGILINYSKSTHPLGDISLHHNAWVRVGGRYPEITCEENDDGPGVSDCAGRTRRYEVSNNVVFQPQRDPIWYSRCTAGGNECELNEPSQFVWLNLVGNIMLGRGGSQAPEELINSHDFLRASQNQLYARDNVVRKGDQQFDALPEDAALRQAAHDFALDRYTETSALLDDLRADVGALPADPMDRRLRGYLGQSADTVPSLDGTAQSPPDAHRFDWTTPPVAPDDSDGDGMPDAYEARHALDPTTASHLELDAAGVPQLEIYLNALADCLRSSTFAQCQAML